MHQVSSISHRTELYVDLPLLEAMDQTFGPGDGFVPGRMCSLSAPMQRHRIYVRAKDGTAKGYIHVDGENVSNAGRPGHGSFFRIELF
ncbi:MAG: hypothetical protein ACLVCH_12295 [Roseburia inulinivorans]